MSTVDGFDRRSADAAKDPALRRSMRKAVRLLGELREGSLRTMHDKEQRRTLAADARQRALENLPELLERLEERLVAAGCKVHYARDASQAREIIGDIALAGGVKRAVKGKSMITEEIELNPYLESLGITAVETDLGEYIVQLNGQAPSHIIAPALHLTKEQVADIFDKKLGRTGKTIPELTQVARETLREIFLSADMGVSGVNMAVAESGMLALIENEGNIRLSTACPRIHVAVMSLEKIIADFDDFVTVMNVLPRFATGQHMPKSLSFFRGPRRPGELDGPEALHLVILDNGRSQVMADPDMRQVLRCIRCGGCQNVCPVYGAVGGHAYGYSYAGPIGSLMAGALLTPDQFAPLAFACTMCGACAEVCPVRIDHPKAILALRRRAVKAGLSPMKNASAKAYATAIKIPTLFRAGAATLRRVDPRLRAVRKLPGMKGMRAYLDQRDGPSLTEPFDPDAKRPDASRPDGKQPEAKRPDAYRPDAKRPNGNQTEARQPDAERADAKREDS